MPSLTSSLLSLSLSLSVLDLRVFVAGFNADAQHPDLYLCRCDRWLGFRECPHRAKMGPQQPSLYTQPRPPPSLPRRSTFSRDRRTFFRHAGGGDGDFDRDERPTTVSSGAVPLRAPPAHAPCVCATSHRHRHRAKSSTKGTTSRRTSSSGGSVLSPVELKPSFCTRRSSRLSLASHRRPRMRRS